MNHNPLARTRIPLSLIFITTLFTWGLAIPVHADDGSLVITDTAVPYPMWFFTALGSSPQSALKFGDAATVVIEVAHDAAIASVTGDFSELGITDPVPFIVSTNRDDHHDQYTGTGIVATRADGTAQVHITVTDVLGNSTNEDLPVRLDNTPPAFSIDSLSFVNTTTPALQDSLLVSGNVDSNETKVYVSNTYYTLYAVDESELAEGPHGFFKNKEKGTALSDLGLGPFTDDSVQLWEGWDGIFHVPDATYISLTAALMDGAGNVTFATSSLTRIPHDVPQGTMSNILFLPGIEGSRLYTSDDGAEQKIWDPSSDTDLAELSLDATGKSMRDVYTKEGDTIDSIGPFKFYDSFADDMNSLKNAGAIADWRAIAYDWRLSPEDVVHNGAQRGTDIDYGEGTDTPYIEETLRALAATSKTGKVTIIAHSAGGLVAKALMQKLGNAETARLIDNVVFVGVPQSGTPQALAGLLHGYGTALPADWCASWEAIGSFCSEDASRAESRALAENMPMTYDLLPSSEYFADVQDALHPLVSFAADHLFAAERSAYGFIVQNVSELAEFGTAAEGGRAKPAPSNLSMPNILNGNLIGAAGESHDALDAWVPPSSVHVYQVAGWGADTLSGIEYYETQDASGTYVPQYRPQFVEDGDSTVTIPSALMMPLSDTVTRYWINLTDEIGLQPLGGAVHQNLLEMRSVREFIRDILTGKTDSLPEGITSIQPVDINPKKKLLFTLHGRAQATLKDSSGQSTVLNTDGSVTSGIPGIEAGLFGDTEFMIAPLGELYDLILTNADSDAINVDVQQMDGGVITSTDTLDVPAGQDVNVSADGSATTTPAPSAPSGGVSPTPSRRPIYTVRTKGVANSKSVLKTGVNAKPVVPKVTKTATTTKKVVTPKAKPLTKKAKTAISALLDELTAELQGLLTKLPH